MQQVKCEWSKAWNTLVNTRTRTQPPSPHLFPWSTQGSTNWTLTEARPTTPELLHNLTLPSPIIHHSRLGELLPASPHGVWPTAECSSGCSLPPPLHCPHSWYSCSCWLFLCISAAHVSPLLWPKVSHFCLSMTMSFSILVSLDM